MHFSAEGRKTGAISGVWRPLTRGSRLAAAVAGALAAGAAGCTLEPDAALIGGPTRPATVLPAQVPPTRPDGLPNTLADPATVPGLPRRPAEIERRKDELEARRRSSQSATAGVAGGGFTEELTRRGRTHAEETRRTIEASGRAGVAAPAHGQDAPAAAPSSAAVDEGPAIDAGRMLDPAAPAPRAVGGPPFNGEAVAREK